MVNSKYDSYLHYIEKGKKVIDGGNQHNEEIEKIIQVKIATIVNACQANDDQESFVQNYFIYSLLSNYTIKHNQNIQNFLINCGLGEEEIKFYIAMYKTLNEYEATYLTYEELQYCNTHKFYQWSPAVKKIADALLGPGVLTYEEDLNKIKKIVDSVLLYRKISLLSDEEVSLLYTKLQAASKHIRQDLNQIIWWKNAKTKLLMEAEPFSDEYDSLYKDIENLHAKYLELESLLYEMPDDSSISIADKRNIISRFLGEMGKDFESFYQYITLTSNGDSIESIRKKTAENIDDLTSRKDLYLTIYSYLNEAYIANECIQKLNLVLLHKSTNLDNLDSYEEERLNSIMMRYKKLHSKLQKYDNRIKNSQKARGLAKLRLANRAPSKTAYNAVYQFLIITEREMNQILPSNNQMFSSYESAKDTVASFPEFIQRKYFPDLSKEGIIAGYNRLCAKVSERNHTTLIDGEYLRSTEKIFSEITGKSLLGDMTSTQIITMPKEEASEALHSLKSKIELAVDSEKEKLFLINCIISDSFSLVGGDHYSIDQFNRAYQMLDGAELPDEVFMQLFDSEVLKRTRTKN